MTKILGLDLGANSLGWCLIDDELYNSNVNPILDSGVRVFEAGIENYGTAKEKSKNVVRRDARMRRRQLQRKGRRLDYLVNILEKNKFVTDINKLQISLINDDPYLIRKELLDNQIDSHLFSRALYHIAKHRGYKKLETAQSVGSDEDLSEKSPLIVGSDDKIGMAELDKILESKKYRSLGEYFSELNPHEIRIRNRYTRRKYYTDEFELIWESQKKFNPSLFNDKAKEEIFEALFFQNKLKSQKDKIGKCKFEPKKPRAPKSHPLYQEFRMLQTVNNIKFTKGHRSIDNKELTTEEREKLIEWLSNTNEIVLKTKQKKKTRGKNNLELNSKPKETKDFVKLRKLFNIRDEYFELNFNKIKGLETKNKIERALNSKENIDEDLLFEIYSVLCFKDDNNWFINYAQKKWGFDETQATKLSKINLENGYGELSLFVIRGNLEFKTEKNENKEGILKYLRQGYKFNEAMKFRGNQHNLNEEGVILRDKLGEVPIIANPVVTVALHQLRKVVNEVIDRYGKPDRVHIELARDLKMSEKDKENYIENQLENEFANSKAREILIHENIVRNPTRNDIIKYRLWKESKKICPYSGEEIALKRLFNNDIEIEHIIPYSKSLDNSYANKTICVSKFNKLKNNMTPKEAFKNNWQVIENRIRKILPDNKVKKFMMSMEEYSESDGSGFISQQLNDTRYISREATKYLKQICGDVVNVKGQVTSYIRKFWNLNHILPEIGLMRDKIELNKGEKSRLDHRHHAVDAITVALTNRSTLQRLANYNRIYGVESIKRNSNEFSDVFPAPWTNLTNDVKESLSNIIISHKVKRKRSGKLHKETYYGLRKNPNGEVQKDDKKQTLYSVRKPIKTLTRKMLGQIADTKIKDMIFHKAKELHLDIDKKKDLETLLNQEYHHRTKTGDEVAIRKVRIRVPSGNIRQIADYNKWAEPGNNHAIVIYKNVESGKTEGTVFTLLDALKEFEKFDKTSIIKWLQSNINYEVEFINTLKANELIYFGNSFPDGFDILDKETYHHINEHIYRVQKLNYGDQKMTFQQHSISQVSYKDSNGLELNPGRLIKMPNTLNFIKLKIDANGYLELSDD